MAKKYVDAPYMLSFKLDKMQHSFWDAPCDSKAVFQLVSLELSLYKIRGDQIFFSATCPGQVASKNPLVLRNFLLVPKYFSNRKSIVRLQIPLFCTQNVIQIKLSCG